MGLTLELPAELATSLTEEANREGLSLPDYAVRVLAARSYASVKSGADLVAFWRAEGVIGTRPDIIDSPAHARTIREKAQQRG
jgi:hypothetical protein